MAKERAFTDRQTKTPVNKRRKHYILLLDLAKAFDTIDRKLLIQKLISRGFSPYIVNLVAHMLSHTQHQFESENVKYFSNIGVPQGSVLSPLLFDIYIDDLLQMLEPSTIVQRSDVSRKYDRLDDPGLRALAYADDIAMSCSGNRIKQIVEKVETWCRVNGLALNKEKSAILQIRLDRRTRPPIGHINDIPFCTQAKYLGVTLDDDLSFRIEAQDIKSKLDSLWKQLSLATEKLPGQVYFIWKTLIESKLM